DRPADRHRAAGREPRDPAVAGHLVRHDVRQPADRAGAVDDPAAAGRDVPDHRQRRRAGAAADRQGGHRPGWQGDADECAAADHRRLGAGGEDGTDDARGRGGQGRDGAEGGHRRVPGGRQDRHGAAAEPGLQVLLGWRILGDVRRHGTGGQAGAGDVRGDHRAAGRRRGRVGRRPALPRRDVVRADRPQGAADGHARPEPEVVCGLGLPPVSGTTPLRPLRPRTHHLAELATGLGLPVPDRDAVVTGITHDSSAVRPGDLLAALPGSHTHGARFAGVAAAAGATAIYTDRAGAELAAPTGLPVLVADQPRVLLGALSAAVWGDPTADMLVLGVTGTNGKTTTAYLLEEGLRAAGHSTGLVGTIETRVAGESVPSIRTTPEATDLQAAFAAMAERGVTAVAIEVSSHALALGRVDGTRFTAGAFTNLSRDHLDFHHDMDGYFAAKALLFDGRCEHEVVTVDDPYGRRLVKPGTVTVSATGDPAADWRAVEVGPAAGGSTGFRVLGPDGVDLPALVRMPGLFNVANGLLAIATLVAVGVPALTAAGGVASRGVPGRME